MKLGEKEKKVLTILDTSIVNGFDEEISNILKISIKEIRDIIKFLMDEGFIEIIDLKVDDKKLYSHTIKVKRGMLDDDLHYIYGSRPKNTYEE